MAAEERAATFAINDLVFVPNDEEGFIPATVVQEFKKGDEGKVRLTLHGNRDMVIDKKQSAKVDRMDAQSYKDVSDMITLRLLNEPALLYNLRLRYVKDKMQIYTNIGAILVAINPFMDLGLYNSDVEDKYLTSGQQLSSLPPHIFKVAEAAFANMRIEDKDQSCVITGESGAGKTETTKRFLQYVSERSKRNRDAFGGDMGLDTERLRTQILDSNPFMEAFGNAKTLRNDNSSRFGKLIEMFFETGKGVVIGAQITNYLLEKSRVVKVGKGERNYHIFYQLCAASQTQTELKKEFHLMTADQFNYAKGENGSLQELAIEGESDAQVYEETKQAMKKLNMTDDEIKTTFRICAGILHLGNIEFAGSNKDLSELKEGVRDTGLKFAAKLLGVNQDELEKAIIFRQLATPGAGAGAATIQKQHTVQEAEAARDALGKFVYEKLFDWLIQKMNQAMKQEDARKRVAGVPRVMGVLDIFGFETFQINSFEQMCINFCNEKLQAFFNDHVFKKEQQEYREEAIDVAEIGFSDNQGVIDVLEKGPKAVMIICDEQSSLEMATDDLFYTKVRNNAAQMNDKDAHKKFLFTPKIQDIRAKPHLKSAFTVKHFAGFVNYNVEGYLEKNKDQLRTDIRICLANSRVKLLADLFPGGGDDAPGRQAKFKNTLGTKFRQSLTKLMNRLNLTTPQFVRCIKPNDSKEPGLFDPVKSLKQLNEAGLLEVCKIRKLGYPIKKTHKEFMNDYLCLHKSASNVTDLCVALEKEQILFETNKSPNWQVGKTKVFLRSEQVFELDRRRGEALEGILKIIQKFARRAVFKAKVNLALKALKKIKLGLRKKDPEVLMEGLTFFIEKGPLFAKLPVVLQGLEQMKELQIQLDLVNDLKTAMKDKDFGTIKVKLRVADELNMNDHPVVKDAAAQLDQIQTEKEVNNLLQEAIGAADVPKLKKAIKFAEENGYGTSKQCKSAERLLKTLEERNLKIEMLRAELGKDTLNVDELANLVEQLRATGVSDDHPLILEAARKGDLIIEKKKKLEKQINMLEKQLQKNLKKKNLAKLEELVAAAVKLQYTGPLVTEAVDMMKNLQYRQEMLDEVSNAARVLREKSKLPAGVSEKDLVPLRHAIKTAEGAPRLDLDQEIQVKEGHILIEQMLDQIKVQDQVTVALKKNNQQNYYKMLEKVQSLGLQTKDADTLVQKVREIEMLKAKADAINNEETVTQMKTELQVPTAKQRKKHLIDRVVVMYSDSFRKDLKGAWKSRDLAMRNYYKVRSDADFTSRERGREKDMRKKMKHAYQENKPLTKSLIEMDDLQEVKALQISQTINKLCDGLSGNSKSTMEAHMLFVVEFGICDTVLADEIYIQLAKHLTANPNALSKQKAWHLMCLCATYFAPTKRFLPYVLHFLQNTVNDVGLEGNYAKYTLAQISSSLQFDAKELRMKPSNAEVRAFFERPPVLAQLELVDGKREDVPIPPDFSLQDAAAIIRKRTGVMIGLKNPEWAVYIRATVKPPKLTYKTRLENFYRHYKPENLGNVDQILAYYKGAEQSLFHDLTSTANYGPEPTHVAAGGEKKKGTSRSSRAGSRASNAQTGGSNSTTPLQELDEIFSEGDTQSTMSSGSSMSVRSMVSTAGSVISKVFRRARGLSTVNVEDLDVPNPTIAWPLPWWVNLGDIMNALYEQDLVPVLTYKRRMCKMKGHPDENLYLQLQRDFLDGILTPFTEGENARLSVMILAIRLLKAKKTVPYGNRTKLLAGGLMKCIPRRLRKQNRKNEEWLDAYVEVAAEKSTELKELDVAQLQRMFFEECVQFPTYGMSFFFAQMLNSNVKSYIARAQADENESALKIGVNQNEIAFFQNGEKYLQFSYDEMKSYEVDGTTIKFKIRKGTKKKAGDDYQVTVDTGPKKKKTLRGNMFQAFSGAKNLIFGAKTEVYQLYTLQPREMFDLIYFFRHLPKTDE